MRDKSLLDVSGKLTQKSLDLCSQIFDNPKNNGNFSEFWEEFPRDDKFGNFPLTRVIRTNKRNAERSYNAALNKGIKHEQLISALRKDVAFRMKSSLSKNNLKYIPGPYRWLNDETYLSWIDKTEDKGKDMLPDII